MPLLPAWLIKNLVVLGIGIVVGANCTARQESVEVAAVDDTLKKVRIVGEDTRGKIVKGRLGNNTFWAIVKDGEIIEIELHNEWGQVYTDKDQEAYITKSLEERGL